MRSFAIPPQTMKKAQRGWFFRTSAEGGAPTSPSAIGFSLGQRHQFVVVAIVQLPVVVVADDIHILLSREIVVELARGGRPVLVPDPDQVVEVVVVDHAGVHFAVKLLRAARAGAPAPPEETAVVFVHGPPENSDVRVLELL